MVLAQCDRMLQGWPQMPPSLCLRLSELRGSGRRAAAGRQEPQEARRGERDNSCRRSAFVSVGLWNFLGTPAFPFLPLPAGTGQWGPLRMKGPRRRDVEGSWFMLVVAATPFAGLEKIGEGTAP